MSVLRLLGVVLGLALYSGAMAAPAPDGGCQTGTPQGEEACLRPDLKEVEAALERQYRQLARKLVLAPRSANTRAPMRLEASQQAWRQYRTHYCPLEGVASAGTGEWLQVRILECQMRLTKDRLESLRDIEAMLE